MPAAGHAFGKSIPKEYTWESIFSVDEGDYHNCLAWIRSKYHGMDPADYRSLPDCVNHAIQNGSHAAFAHYFLMERHRQNAIFCRKLQELIDQQEKKLPDNQEKKDITKSIRNYSIASCWNQAPIMKQLYWRSFASSSENEIESQINPVYPFGRNGGESPARRKWRIGESIPPRDVIVQIGISLALSYEETDALLLSAGEPVLYVLDVVDLCSIFTLEKYNNNFDIPPKIKLEETKTEINRVLADYHAHGVPFLKTSNVYQLVSNKPLAETIERDIDELRSILEADNGYAQREPATNTTFLTSYYKKRLEECLKAQDISAYLEQGLLKSSDGEVPADDRQRYTAFLQKYYGFLKKTNAFLLNKPTYEKYLRCDRREWILTPEGYEHNLKLMQEHARRREPRLAERSISSSKEREEDPPFRKVEKIFKITDSPSDTTPRKGSLSLIRQIMEGRQIIEGKTDRSQNIEKKKESGYQSDLSSRLTLIKFLTATGNEDQIDYYMNLSGMWNDNWYNNYKAASSDPAQIDPLQEKSDQYLGRADYMILYALLFRDELIKEWKKRAKLETAKAEQIRGDFPMIQLLLEISRDITLAFMKLGNPGIGLKAAEYGDYDNAAEDKKKEYIKDIKDYEKELHRMMTHELIFPVSWFFQKILTAYNNQSGEGGRELQQHFQLNRGEPDDEKNTPCWKRRIPKDTE